jgi:hypothetical protein
MQMIDVYKRLQELDANNPNIIKESQTVEECGPMGMMPSEPKTPATINITAGSGEELSGMLNAIMQLAGVHKVEPKHLGNEPPPAQLVTVGKKNDTNDMMRSMMDKMNPEKGEEDEDLAESKTDLEPAYREALKITKAIKYDDTVSDILVQIQTLAEKYGMDQTYLKLAMDEVREAHSALASAVYGLDVVFKEAMEQQQMDDEEETDESAGEMYTNSPEDPTKPKAFEPEEYANHENPEGAGKHRRTMQPNATVEAVAQQLFQDYQSFVIEQK